MTCKGICIRHKASGRYAAGHKRCQVCELFIQWEGLFCPCCGSRLRIGPRNIKFKTKLRKQKDIEAKKVKILYHLQNI
jgi:rRNA maturation endonuclease Nob1